MAPPEKPSMNEIVDGPAPSSNVNPSAAAIPDATITALHNATIRPVVHPPLCKPVVAAMPSGKFETNTATSMETPISPVCNNVRPRTADSGMPSSIAPSTIANPEPSGGAPPMSLRSPYPKWSITRSPSVNTAAPANNPSAVDFSAPSVLMPLATSSNATALSKTPAPNDITVPRTLVLGGRTSATTAPISRDAAAATPQNSAAAMTDTFPDQHRLVNPPVQRRGVRPGLPLRGDDEQWIVAYFRS